MKRVLVAVLIVLFMAGTTGATDIRSMRNQPLGWRGWAWGTPLEEVQGWLEYVGNVYTPYVGNEKDWLEYLGDAASLPYWGYFIDDKAFVKPGDPNIYFEKNWEGTQYIFEDEKLVAIALWTRGGSYAAMAIEYYCPGSAGNYTEKAVPGKGEKFLVSAAKGAYASLLYLRGPIPVDSNETYRSGLYWHAIIIGDSEWMKKLIELVYKDK